MPTDKNGGKNSSMIKCTIVIMICLDAIVFTKLQSSAFRPETVSVSLSDRTTVIFLNAISQINLIIFKWRVL
jgi:hypothetical protein